jgi:hypothetical protein
VVPIMVAMVVPIMVAMVVPIMVAMVGATRFTVAAFLGVRTNNGYLILQIFYLNIIPHPTPSDIYYTIWNTQFIGRKGSG